MAPDNAKIREVGRLSEQTCKQRLFTEQVEEFQAGSERDAKQHSHCPSTIAGETNLFPFDSAKAKRYPSEEQEIGCGIEPQDMMVAANKDSSDKDKLDQGQPCAASPRAVRLVSGFGGHFAPRREVTDQKSKKSQPREKILR